LERDSPCTSLSLRPSLALAIAIALSLSSPALSLGVTVSAAGIFAPVNANVDQSPWLPYAQDRVEQDYRQCEVYFEL
jgi:hypothetical protein